MLTHLQIALQRFIDDVSVEVVETCLIKQLEQVFNTLEVVKMSKEKISQIAGETERSKRIRDDLQKQLDVLTKGMDICKEFAVVDITSTLS
jgi:hypothetical protein